MAKMLDGPKMDIMISNQRSVMIIVGVPVKQSWRRARIEGSICASRALQMIVANVIPVQTINWKLARANAYQPSSSPMMHV